MHLTAGTQLPVCVFQTQNGANAVRIARWPFQRDAQPRASVKIVIKLGRIGVLAGCEVRASIVIVVADSGATALTIDEQTAFRGRERLEVPLAIAPEEDAAASIVARRIRSHGEEILIQEGILIAVAIEIGDRQSEDWRQLRIHR